MAFQPAPACASAILRYTSAVTGGFLFANVLNFKSGTDTNFTVGDLENLGDAIASWWASNVEALMSDGVSLQSIQLRGLESQEAAYTTMVYNYQGNVTSPRLPMNAAAVLTLRTSFTGRSARGRIYHAGLCEVQVGGDNLNSPFATALQTAYAALPTDVESNVGAQLCVLSRFNNGAMRPTAVPYVVTSVLLRDARIDTQRRRLGRAD
jgi:hypothetical protein